MISYIKNIKNPALKCFIHVLPFFVGFFILKDFGTDIGAAIKIFFISSTTALSPMFRFCGEYIMGLIAFIAVWSIYVYFCMLKTEKEHNIIKMWKTISHIATVVLFFYGLLYISDTSHLMNQLRAIYKPTEALNYSSNLIFFTGIVCFMSVVANIYLVGTMRSFNNELKKKEQYS